MFYKYRAISVIELPINLLGLLIEFSLEKAFERRRSVNTYVASRNIVKERATFVTNDTFVKIVFAHSSSLFELGMKF